MRGRPGPDRNTWPTDLSAGLLAPTSNTLLVVAETGSFSAAARALGVRQSTVSRQIRDLEDWVGVSLFERRSEGTQPTDAGRELLSRLVQVRNIARSAVTEARDFGAVRTGRLRLGFIGSFATSPARDILARVREQHAGLAIQLAELGASDLIAQVLSHQLDCGWVASWRSPDPALATERLWAEALYLALPASPPGPDCIGWSALAGRVLLARPEAELELLFDALRRAGVRPPEVQLHDCSRESMVALVAEGHGVAILPESYARLGRPGVRFALICEPGAEVAVCAMYRRDRDNPALRRLLAITRDWLRENPPGHPRPATGS